MCFKTEPRRRTSMEKRDRGLVTEEEPSSSGGSGGAFIVGRRRRGREGATGIKELGWRHGLDDAEGEDE